MNELTEETSIDEKEYIQDSNITLEKSKKKKDKHVLYNGKRTKVKKEDKDKYLIDVEVYNDKGFTETREQWFYRDVLEIVDK